MLQFLRSIFVNSLKLNVAIRKTGNKLEADLEFYKIKIPKSRKAKYYLGCYDGSVFIDLIKAQTVFILKEFHLMVSVVMKFMVNKIYYQKNE